MAELLPGLSILDATRSSLEAFLEALRRWSAAINLIAPDTVHEAWERHILDSAQLYPLAGEMPAHWADLGSGGGLPGLIVAIIARDLAPGTRFTLVESDRRKSAFLLSQIGALGLNARVETARAEALKPLQAGVVSARALAPLPRLLPLIARHLAPEGLAILPKGRRWATELAEVEADWRFQSEALPSQFDPDARILRLTEIRPEPR